MDWFDCQDEIKLELKNHLATNTTAHWLEILEAADIWCAQVYNWDQLLETEGFRALDMIQTVKQDDELSYETTRCPIKIDQTYLKSERSAPNIGEQNKKYNME